MKTRRVIFYLRVSTDEQHLGPEAQRAVLTKWCEENDGQAVATFEDLGVSGSAPLDKRPGLLMAIDALQKGDVLLVAKRDRLARDVINAAVAEKMAEKAGGRIMSDDGADNGDGPDAWLMRTIKDAFAQYEVLMVRARTKSALAVKKARGERVGQVPFGSCLAANGVTLEDHPIEQRVIAMIGKYRSEGVSIREIANKLNLNPDAPARGKQWHATTVARVLKRAA